jgi:hypothetical protein
MVKFSGKNDKAYEMVKENIEEIANGAEEAARNFVPSMYLNTLKLAYYLTVKRSTEKGEGSRIE